MAVRLDPLPITYEQFRSLVVRVVARFRSGQIADLTTYLASASITFGIVQPPPTVQEPRGHDRGIRFYDVLLARKDIIRTNSIIWDLIIEGVIRPGNGETMDDLPFYHVTEFGSSRITHEGERPTPYDPDGYLAKLKDTIPTIDPIIITYLDEASRTFRINCLLSSAVTLGCAAEKGMLLLMDAYADSLLPDRGKRFRDKIAGKFIKGQVDEFDKALKNHVLPSDLAENLETSLDGIFALIRSTRNDAGHPKGVPMDRDLAYSTLTMFPHYVEKVYALMAWFKNNAPLA
jgi:hypothetical protein